MTQEEKEKEYSPWLAIPKLKEAALEFGEQAKDYEIGGQSFTEDMAVAFTRGAEWQKKQILNEAIEADVNIYGDIVAGKKWVEFVVEMPIKNLGNKVKIIVVKET